MSTYCTSHDESIFSDSFTFNPNRWLNDPKGPDGQRPLSRYMVSFGKGNRICLGMHLAYAELFMGLASVFTRVEMRLWETGKGDVECEHDMMMPHPRRGSKGVRVMVL